MLIDDLGTRRDGGITSHRAVVRWEDRSKTPVEVSFSLFDRDAELTSLNPDAFRIPAAVVALHDGEERLVTEAGLCPALHDGLVTSLSWLRRWWGSPSGLPVLESPLECSHPEPGAGAPAAAFLSGGVDSLSLLQTNLARYPVGHPARIEAGIVVGGIQRHRWSEDVGLERRLATLRAELSPIAKAAGIRLLPVVTNLRELNPSTRFWQFEYQGAALAGVAHLFAHGLSGVGIASSWVADLLGPFGSHPLIDDGYRTHAFGVRHELAHLGRLRKTEVVAENPVFLQDLKVCNTAEAGDGNCGRCEKCVRTLLALVALDRLSGTSAFGRSDLDATDLRRVTITDAGHEGEYVELIEPLRRAGREDLADAVERRVRSERLRRRYPRVWGIPRAAPRLARLGRSAIRR